MKEARGKKRKSKMRMFLKVSNYVVSTTYPRVFF